MTVDTLTAAGYPPHEISNFSRPGRECRHNLAYWHGADYLGLGPSAFSTVGERRWSNVRDTAAFIARINAGEPAADFREDVPPATRTAETHRLRVRTDRGVAETLLTPWAEVVAGTSARG